MGTNLPTRCPAESGFIYSELGDYDKALAAYQQALRVKPETGNGYANLATGYLQLNRLDEVKATAREAHAHNMESPEIHLDLYWVDFLKRDAAGMEQEAAALMGKPGDEDQMLNYESDTCLVWRPACQGAVTDAACNRIRPRKLMKERPQRFMRRKVRCVRR